jgi:acyl-CoA synthetase (AMP-forming)/AMP-acid ligase II
MSPPKRKHITDYLDVHASLQPEKEFLHDQERNQSLSFREVRTLVDRLCLYFQSLGLRHGDRIILYLENSLDFCLLLLASLRYGAVVCPYPDMFIPAELIRDAELFQPCVVFARPSKEAELGPCSGRFIPVPEDTGWIPPCSHGENAPVF